jgi:uncharacterized protein YrrD
MTSHPDIVKQSDLLNQLILDRYTMAELGQVEVLWMYPKVHRVLGFISKSGFLGAKKAAFNLDQLHTLGAKSILVNSAPMATDAEKVRELESLVHCEVWTDDGNQVGKIVDYLFNLKTGAIQAYLFVANGWGGLASSVYKLPPGQILNLGHRRVLIGESAMASLEIYRAGIQEKLTKATELLKEEKTHVAAEVRSLFQQAKTATSIAKERAQALAEQAKEQLLETTQILTEEIIDRTDAIADPKTTDADWDDEWELETLPARPAPSAPPSKSTPTPPPQPDPRPASADDLDDLWDDEWDNPPAVPHPTPAPPAPSRPAPRSNILDADDDDEPWI